LKLICYLFSKYLINTALTNAVIAPHYLLLRPPACLGSRHLPSFIIHGCPAVNLPSHRRRMRERPTFCPSSVLNLNPVQYHRNPLWSTASSCYDPLCLSNFRLDETHPHEPSDFVQALVIWRSVIRTRLPFATEV